MSAVFADTFYWIAVTNIQDLAHASVTAFTRQTKPDIVCTTEEVLTEYLNYFAAWGPHFRRRATLNVQRLNVQSMMSNQNVRVVAQTANSFRSGFDLYRTRLDKGYSLTDCISMQTMRDQGITNILTNDAHFTQEGFRALLRGDR